jgi:predicted nucleic acid-binding protein
MRSEKSLTNHEPQPRFANGLQNLPPWLVILKPGPRIVSESGLHPGELAAMELAEHLGRQTLLIDDQRGKREAIRRGLPVIGTIGVLYESGLIGILDFEHELDFLLKTNFHLSQILRVRYLELWKLSKAGKSSHNL